MSFLNAEWRKLAIANYVVDEKLLEKYIPTGTELDIWKGKCYLSLVSFMFVNTKVLGVKIPFHVNFEEANLRFYVKRFENEEWKRGVVFIKEIVPKNAITFVANTLYKENYQTMPMQHHWNESTEKRTVHYKWKCAGKWHNFNVEGNLQSVEIPPESETEFITEHYWGYAKINDTTTNEYEVTHPRWKAYKVFDYKIDVDFGLVYGSEFEFMNRLQPESVMLAEGSEITVEKKRKITN